MLRIRTDVPLPDVDVSCFDYRGPDRQKCFELFSTLGFRSLVTEFAPTADTVDTDYAVVTTEDGLAALIAELEGAGRFAMSVIGDCPGGMRAALVGVAFSTSARRARYLPIGHTALDEPSALNPRTAPGGAEDGPRKPRDREDRPRSEVRFDDAVARGHRARRPRVRHDARQLRARRHPVEPHDRGDRARASGLQGAHAGRHLRHRPEGHRAAAPAGGCAAQLRR